MDFDSIPQELNTQSRITILVALYKRDKEFRHLDEMLNLTEGNLSNQLRYLEKAGYIASSQMIVGRRLRRTYSLTPFGRQIISDYVSLLARPVRINV